MSSLFRPRTSFLQNTAWQNQALNALHYNTAQQGSVIPLIYGTTRQQVNVIDLNNYRGPQGKKGKSGSLPISGTSQSGKGGGGGKGKGGKKNADYTVDVDFALCQGPVSVGPFNTVYTSSGVAPFAVTGLHFYDGSDGQAPDPHFNLLGYSGTCHITGTPLDLGQSPVLPNIAVEITGILAGVHTGGYPRDANPADVVMDFLTNPRYGAEFPTFAIDALTHDDSGHIHNTYGDYCQAASLMISVSLDGHQKAIEWLDGITKLTNSAIVFSGGLLRIIPYGDLPLNNNGTTWDPNWTAQYNLTDDHFLPFRPHQDGGLPTPGEDDPIVMVRTNPADADNWVSMEYTDRNNFYNSTILTAFDQGAIDTYGLRIGDSLPGRVFTNPNSAMVSLRLILQRRLYIRNTGIKFQLGWQFALLEPMDLVSLTGRVGDTYLSQYTMRILSIEENDNGDLTLTVEDPVLARRTATAGAPPVSYPPGVPAVFWTYGGGAMEGCSIRVRGITAQDPIYDWNFNHPPDSPVGTFSVWVNMDESNRPRHPGEPQPNNPSITSSGDFFGLIRTSSGYSNYVESVGDPLGTDYKELVIDIGYELDLIVYLGGLLVFKTDISTITADGIWKHILVTWDLGLATPGVVSADTYLTVVRCWVNGLEFSNVYVVPSGSTVPSTVAYSHEGTLFVGSSTPFDPATVINFAGCTNDLWWDPSTVLNNPGLFRDLNGAPRYLGPRGEAPSGSPPRMYLSYSSGNPDYTFDHPVYTLVPGDGWYGINRAGLNCDNSAYWHGVNGSVNAFFCDPAHPNLIITADSIGPIVCSSPIY